MKFADVEAKKSMEQIDNTKCFSMEITAACIAKQKLLWDFVIF